MNKTAEFLRALSARLWDIVAVACAITCVAVLVWYISLYGKKELSTPVRLVKTIMLLSKSESFDTNIAREELRKARLERLSAALAARPSYDESAMLASLYHLADSTECKTVKVSVEEPVTARQAFEQPVLFIGEGTYRAIGALVEGVESMEFQTRIRQLTLQSDGSETGKVTVDFIAIKGTQEHGR